MKIPLKNMAPTCVVLAMALFCCWPYMEQPLVIDDAPAEAKIRDISNSVVAAAQSAERNPFSFFAVNDGANETENADDGSVPFEPASYDLGATLIGVSRSGAVINGKYYTTGQRIEHPQQFPVTLMHVDSQRVVLKENGHTRVLRYKRPEDKVAGQSVVPTPHTAVERQQSDARRVRESNEGRGNSIADLLFRASRIAKDVRGQDKEDKP